MFQTREVKLVSSVQATANLINRSITGVCDEGVGEDDGRNAKER